MNERLSLPSKRHLGKLPPAKPGGRKFARLALPAADPSFRKRGGKLTVPDIRLQRHKPRRPARGSPSGTWGVLLRHRPTLPKRPAGGQTARERDNLKRCVRLSQGRLISDSSSFCCRSSGGERSLPSPPAPCPPRPLRRPPPFDTGGSPPGISLRSTWLAGN